MNLKASFLVVLFAQTNLGDIRAASVATEFVGFGATGTALVPVDGALGESWTTNGFDDSSWLSGPSPFGYGYQPSPNLAEQTLLRAQMLGINPSAYFRFEFTVANPSAVETLMLNIYHDDGFIAYLNGIAVASENAPALPGWNSRATSNSEAFFNDPAGFDLTGAINNLVQGNNTLAIHGMNASVGSSDFLVAPSLSGTINQVPEPRGLTLLGLTALLALRRSRN